MFPKAGVNILLIMIQQLLLKLQKANKELAWEKSALADDSSIEELLK